MSPLWQRLRDQARQLVERNPVLGNYATSHLLAYETFEDALAANLARQMQAQASDVALESWFKTILKACPSIAEAAAADINHLEIVNPACPDHLTAFLTFRGIQAVQVYRIAHALWTEGDVQSAVLVQNWAANTWSIDIHPAARLGTALFVDHGIGLVIGETAVVEDEVSLWHGVTLGSTLAEAGDRHPKIRRGALICAGATVLGNIEVGANAIVAANSVVLKPVAAGTVVAGTPAKVVGNAPAALATFTTKAKG
ncbi:Serine acetyltransferase [Pseudomonas coronafaciens pv. atropurpurea]|uniref:serine O-acetyltransferase EpsC n=1 Tax=Pseudomonas coronafaciens TaxID=53409 RepID=UPI0006D60D25|nr:serine O-acetyltransferase EpsC [Pseudomonas coronafaciens]KPW34617.1 Serine acetyltransferase [Pseudomonas coronafaciens pv. atropurpurea]RMT53875.1 Serine acetyltransferase [Pseudomonas coronafaciens pv. atropurpurea]